MSQSTDPDHFFQTTDSITTARRKAAKSKNNHGNPIRLPSKILALIPDPTSPNHVYVAEAAGTVRRVSLEVAPARPESDSEGTRTLSNASSTSVSPTARTSSSPAAPTRPS
ncbi:MAG: hypothetical protein Q9187_007008 [Circinaria calcarea]